MTPRKITNYITSKEVEFIIKKLPTWKSSGPDGFTGESYHTSDNNNDTNNNTSASQTLPKNGGGRSLLSEKHYFYALIPKPNTSQEKKTTDHYPSRIDVKIFNKILVWLFFFYKFYSPFSLTLIQELVFLLRPTTKQKQI